MELWKRMVPMEAVWDFAASGQSAALQAWLSERGPQWCRAHLDHLDSNQLTVRACRRLSTARVGCVWTACGRCAVSLRDAPARAMGVAPAAAASPAARETP
jgi:hypothetical protein